MTNRELRAVNQQLAEECEINVQRACSTRVSVSSKHAFVDAGYIMIPIEKAHARIVPRDEEKILISKMTKLDVKKMRNCAFVVDGLK